MALDVNECLKQVKLLTTLHSCAAYSVLPSNSVQ